MKIYGRGHLAQDADENSIGRAVLKVFSSYNMQTADVAALHHHVIREMNEPISMGDFVGALASLERQGSIKYGEGGKVKRVFASSPRVVRRHGRQYK